MPKISVVTPYFPAGMVVHRRLPMCLKFQNLISVQNLRMSTKQNWKSSKYFTDGIIFQVELDV